VQRVNHLQVNKQKGKCVWRSKLLLVEEVRAKGKIFYLFFILKEEKKNKAWCAGNLLLSSLSLAQGLTLTITALLGIREIEIEIKIETERKRKQSLLLFFLCSELLLSEVPLWFVRRSIYVFDSCVWIWTLNFGGWWSRLSRNLWIWRRGRHLGREVQWRVRRKMDLSLKKVSIPSRLKNSTQSPMCSPVAPSTIRFVSFSSLPCHISCIFGDPFQAFFNCVRSYLAFSKLSLNNKSLIASF